MLTVSDQPLGSFGTMVCQKVSYLNALSLDISGGGEVVDKPLFSETCDSLNVTVLEFLSVPIPTSSTVASPKAISCSPPEFVLFCVVWPPSTSKILFPVFSPLGPKQIWELGEKEFCLSHTDTPIDGICFALPPFFILGSSNFESAKYMSKFLAHPIA